MKFSFQRRLTGKRSGKRCVAPAARNRRARSCTRLVAFKTTLTRPMKKGARRVAFSGRLSARVKLPAGDWQLTAVATDNAGRRSTPRSARFKLLRAPARRR